MARSEIRKVWESRIADYQASGLSGSQWCEMNQVKLPSFYYWKRKIKNTASPSPQWVSLQVESTSLDVSDSSLLVKIGSAVIDVKPGFDRELLSDVVLTLQSLC